MSTPLAPRVPTALALALIVCGCAAGVGTGAKVPKKASGPVPLATKLQKVDVMTRAFSFTHNDGLKEATTALTKNQGLLQALQSLQSVTTSLSGAFGSVSNVIAAGGGNMVAAGGGNVVAAGGGNMVGPDSSGGVRSGAGNYAVMTSLQAAAARDAAANAPYQLAATVTQGTNTLTYDDQTKELTGVTSADTALAFTFKNDGRTRSWDAQIVRSKDGTTGSLHLQITGDWQPQPTPPPVTGACQPLPGFDNPTPQDQALGQAPPCAFDLSAPPSPPPFKVLGGEIPKSVEALTVAITLVPQGNSALAIKLGGTFDDATPLPDGMGPPGTRVPLHWALQASVPKVSATWDSHIKVAKGASSFAVTGTLAADGGSGTDHFSFDAQATEAKKDVHFGLANDDAKVRVQVDAASDGTKPSAKLVSTEDNSQLGTLTMDPARPGIAVIHLADGTTKDWELFPVTPTPAQPAPAPSFPDNPFGPQ